MAKENSEIQHQFSKEAASDLMTILLDRGYFDETEPLQQHPNEDSMDFMYKIKEQRDPKRRMSLNVCTLDGRYLTRSRLTQELVERLGEKGSRMTMEEAAKTLDIKQEDLAAIIPEMDDIKVVGDNLLLVPAYFDELIPTISTHLQAAGGNITVSEIASQLLHLPTEVVLSEIEPRLERLGARIVSLHGTNVLVTPEFEKQERSKVHNALKALTEPTTVSCLCHDHGWDVDHVLPIVRDFAADGKAGHLHESSTAFAAGALYTPSTFESLQRQGVDDFFSSHGYVTAEKCQSLRIPPSSMGDYVKASFPEAVALNSSIINPSAIVTPLAAALQATMAENSFLDLRLHVADEILNHELDARQIVEEMALSELNMTLGEAGLLVISADECLFFSNGMAKKITNDILPPLIESFAKTRATEMESTDPPKLAEDEAVDEKKKRRGKMKRKGKSQPATATYVDIGVVPLVIVAKEVAKAEPDLADIQASFGPLFESDGQDAPKWETDDNGEVGGPLYEFCRQGLYSDSFRAACDRAVQAELERIQSAKHSTSVRGRKEGAARIRSIEAAFEAPSCFNAACYRLQAHVKFIDFLSTVEIDDTILSSVKQEFLSGWCADFARRVTQYCLFKNELDEGIFVFEGETTGTSEELLPDYCRPIDSTRRRIPPTVFSCHKEEDGKTKDPLATLRVVLSGNIGVTVARMWTFCGGGSYSGGARTSSDGSVFVRPGDIDGFMKYVEDNCLTMCGLPFKKMEKKSEKQFMFARRQELIAQLEAAKEGNDVLELTVMLLYQQVKGLAVAGSALLGAFLPILVGEKKIPEPVAQLLTTSADRIVGGAELENDTVARIRACGLCKDISKHELA